MLNPDLPGGPAFSIRPVSGADLPAILEVYRQCEDFLALGPKPHASQEMVLKDLELSRREGGIFCGIFVAGSSPGAVEMAGIVAFVPRSFEGDPAKAFLSLLMIAGPYRSLSLGTQVVAAVESFIRQDPEVEFILTAVQVNNPSALRFWQRCSYKIASGPLLQPDSTITYRLCKLIK